MSNLFWNILGMLYETDTELKSILILCILSYFIFFKYFVYRMFWNPWEIIKQNWVGHNFLSLLLYFKGILSKNEDQMLTVKIKLSKNLWQNFSKCFENKSKKAKRQKCEVKDDKNQLRTKTKFVHLLHRDDQICESVIRFCLFLSFLFFS